MTQKIFLKSCMKLEGLIKGQKMTKPNFVGKLSFFEENAISL